MPRSAPPPPDENQEDRLRRLGAAMEAWLAFRASGEQDSAGFLARHESLRDLLAPMLADAATTEPAHAASDTIPVEPGPDRCLGDYRIRREIGRGGMGTVYEAEQISLGRTVALKVLHRHLAWSPSSIARFRREAAAASRLRHPGIVPIHEVGEWQGLHYFSMELVAGRPLCDLVRAERFGVRADVSRAAEAAELVARIGDALQHAHENDLVHRDVKPHNVMVCPDGSVRLLDFGLVASAAADAAISASGLFLGTPHYCSPEQIAGRDVDPRGDVFALGIVLYELLAGVRPFDGASTQAVLTRIEGGEFARLRKIAPTVPRDLETICHKALEHAPEHRYVNAGALAADLRRFLRIEPIHALPPSTWTRSTKWVRRHRTHVALVAACAVLLVGAPTAYALHLRGTNEVIERERKTLGEAEDIGFRSIEQSLAMLSEQIDRQPGPGARHEPRIDELVQLCEKFLALRNDEVRRPARFARALWEIAGAYLHLGRTDAALTACARAQQLLQAVPARAEPQPALLGRILQRTMQARQQADPAAGDAEFESARAHWQALLARTPGDAEIVADFAMTLLLRARTLADRPERHGEAERLLREALQSLRALPQPANGRAANLVARCEATLGGVLVRQKRNDEALEVLRATIVKIDALPAEPALAVDKAVAEANIGTALQRLGRPQDAETAARTAITTATACLEDWPGSQPLRRALASNRLLLGSQLIVRGKIEDAEAVLREAIPDPAPGAATDTLAETWTDRALRADRDAQLANCILLRGDCTGPDGEEAAALLHSACDLHSALVAAHPTQLDFRIDLGATCNSLASLANERGEFAAAIAFAERAIAAQRAVLAVMPQHRRATSMLGIHYAQLAYGRAHSGDASGAVSAAAQAIDFAPRHVHVLRMAAQAATLACVREGGDAQLPAAERDQRAEAHGKLAVAALARLSEVNRKEALRLLADDRFAPLRSRADFQALQQRVANR